MATNDLNPTHPTDTPQRQNPGVKGDIQQAQEYIGEADAEDSTPGVRRGKPPINDRGDKNPPRSSEEDQPSFPGFEP